MIYARIANPSTFWVVSCHVSPDEKGGTKVPVFGELVVGNETWLGKHSRNVGFSMDMFGCRKVLPIRLANKDP